MRKPGKIRLSKSQDSIKAQLVKLGGLPVVPTQKSPETLGDLFQDVQLSRLYGDGKTFVDLVPLKRMKRITEEYELQRRSPDFNLREFIARHFYTFEEPEGQLYESNPDSSALEHIRELWRVLERRNALDKGSLLALPYPYIAPGGRFREQFYWDTYFIMLGLASEDKFEKIEGMMKNYTYLIRKFGFIPTANRTYFLSRSQPPFFSHMVELLGEKKGRRSTRVKYLPYLLAEYRFWMKSDFSFRLGALPDVKRVVKLPDGSILNRYYDDKQTPRPESYKEDMDILNNTGVQQPSRVHLDLRAAAESGWDFSSRWFRNPNDISTIHTTDILPIDLNCLMYHLENTIAETYKSLFQPILARRFKKSAEKRKDAINKYFWSEKKQYFYDYDFTNKTQTSHITAAGMFPLFVGIATPHQAKLASETMREHLLKAGGVQTTTLNTGQQWDAPNGWAPIQWVVIKGLRNYGYHALAEEVKERWIATNLQVYSKDLKMVEKYNVSEALHVAGGGEYPLQDGFGWTNGVLQALMNEDI